MDDRIREMDGLRGLAVILVMALHIFNRANEFTDHPTLLFISDLTVIGWIGVDLFFVLSGFLITSILLRAREKDDYFRNFYIRRALRILPLYYVTMLIVFLIIVPIKQPGFVGHIPALIPVQVFYLQNWLGIELFVRTTGYLWVTWSLAIEEQFYLFWPALVYFLKRETLVKFTIGYVVLSAVARTVSILVWGEAVATYRFFYYNSFTRFDELMIGGLLAIALADDGWRERVRSLASPVLWGSLLLFITICLVDLPNLPHPNYLHVPLNIFGYPALSIFTAALIAIFVTHPAESRVRMAFRNNLLGFLGRYSYAMYLLHIPVALILLDALWATRVRGWKMYLLYIVCAYLVTVIASLLSWHVLEKHMLNLKKYFQYR